MPQVPDKGSRQAAVDPQREDNDPLRELANLIGPQYPDDTAEMEERLKNALRRPGPAPSTDWMAVAIEGKEQTSTFQVEGGTTSNTSDEVTPEVWNEIRNQVLEILNTDFLDTPEHHLAYV